MHCPRCGTKNKRGAKFCKKCGKPLKEPQDQTSKSRHWLTHRLAIFVALTMVLGAFACLFLKDKEWAGGKQAPKNTSSISMTIPAGGGKAVGPRGASIEFSPESVEEGIQVSMAEIPDPPQPEGEVIFAGPAIKVTSSQEILDVPALLTLPISEEIMTDIEDKSRLSIAYWDGSYWFPVGGKVNVQEKTIAATIGHFSLFAVIRFHPDIPIFSHTTEHFQIKDICNSPDYPPELLGQRLESAWDLIVEDLGYEIPVPVKRGDKIQAWVLTSFRYSGKVWGLSDKLEDRFLAYTNYDIYINCVSDKATPAHELFHIVQLNSYLHPHSKKDIIPNLWWMEATANWLGAKALGDQEYKEHQRFYDQTNSFLTYSLDSLEGKQRFRAGNFFRYLEDQYGANIIKESWELLSVKHSPLQVLDGVLNQIGSSLGGAYFDYAVQYAYLRQPDWLQKSMGIPPNTPEPATDIEIGTEQKTQTIQKDHLSGKVLSLIPNSELSGTLNLTFDFGAQNNIWKIKLFAEKSDGSTDSYNTADLQREYDLPQFGSDIERVVIVAVNDSINQDDAEMKIGYSVSRTNNWELVRRERTADLPDYDFSMTVRYPYIEGSDEENTARFNSIIESFVNSEINTMHDRVKSTTETNVDSMNASVIYGTTTFHDFQTSGYLEDLEGISGADREDKDHVVVNTGHTVLAILFLKSQYLYGVHPASSFKTINYDLTTGEELSLSNLFIPGSTYLYHIASHCSDLLTENLDDIVFIEGTSPTSNNYQNWAVTPKGLLFAFEEYQVAPYAWGPQYVIVPYDRLSDIIDPDGPIGNFSSEQAQESVPTPTSTGFLCPGAPITRLQDINYAHISYKPPLPNKVRRRPGANYSVLGQAQPGDVLKIIGGPKCRDGYVWWKVIVENSGLTGWTAEGNNKHYWLIPCENKESCGNR